MVSSTADFLTDYKKHSPDIADIVQQTAYIYIYEKERTKIWVCVHNESLAHSCLSSVFTSSAS